jgi:hypothetical protein
VQIRRDQRLLLERKLPATEMKLIGKLYCRSESFEKTMDCSQALVFYTMEFTKGLRVNRVNSY